MINKVIFIVFFCAFCLQGFAQKTISGPAIRIALVNNHLNTGEFNAVKKLLDTKKEWSYQLIDLKDIAAGKSIRQYTHIWYHRTDTVPFDRYELSVGAAIKKFVNAGGNLFLSMESVPLLNRWGIEKTPFQIKTDTLVDKGFGRPAGFHAFKSHPLFDGLNGGVYSTKQKKNHVVRVHGFFGNVVPQAGKVAGIQWTYITFNEQAKLLMEYNLGKGSVIAAGAYLYFDADNYNQEHLEYFTGNVFRYTAGQVKNIKKEYWNFSNQVFSASAFNTPVIAPVQATVWSLPPQKLKISQAVAKKDFYDLVGRRILWMGGMNGGVDEIWMHPYMALRDLHLGVKAKGSDSISWLNNIPASVEITPAYLIRKYQVKNTILKEIYTVSFDQPNGVAHVEIEGSDITSVSVKYASNLRYMWPYSSEATGSLKFGYNSAINGHIISGQQGALNTVVTYSSRPLQQKIRAVDSLKQVQVQVEFAVKNKSALNIYIMGSTSSVEDAIKLYAANGRNMNRLFKTSNRYYDNLLKDRLYFETPDTLFNNGYKWALARTDQFLQTTPGIGTALMAGFGTTARGWNGNQKINGRPGYAWYFGRDGQWSAMAINAYGDFAMVKEALETFIRFQDITGKIYHELSSSGAVHYDASDATPLFVILAAHYLKYSGDSGYIRHRWPEIKKAMEFCYSTDSDNDGLIENTNVGHGWIEGGPLFGAHTEFYLAGSWAAALESAAYMAQHIGVGGVAQFTSDANKVKAIIDRDFWNAKGEFFYNGKMEDGSYMPEATVLASVPVYFDVITDPQKVVSVGNRLSNSYFNTDWGMRMVEDSSKKYRPNSYHAGMVWPLYTGWASLSEYKSGHYRSGYQHIMSNLMQYRHWAPGSIEETLNGDVFEPNGVCSHQCWSETMVLQPAIEGMLGLKPDAMNNRLQLSPYFPWHWEYSSVKNIRMQDALLDLDMKRSKKGTTFTINSNKPVTLDFNPVFPFYTSVKSVKVNGRSVEWELHTKPQGLSLTVSFETQVGNNIVEIETQGGVGMIPSIDLPNPGDRSKGCRIVSEEMNGRQFIAEVSGLPDTVYEVQLFHKGAVKNITGATIVKKDGEVLTLQVKTGNGAGNKYASVKIIVVLL